jgi:endonuclease-3
VDTHVKRLSKLLALTREVNPEKVERDLIQLFPQDNWTILSHLFIFHGRKVCYARRPQCQACMMSDLCPSAKI